MEKNYPGSLHSIVILISIKELNLLCAPFTVENPLALPGIVLCSPLTVVTVDAMNGNTQTMLLSRVLLKAVFDRSSQCLL